MSSQQRQQQQLELSLVASVVHDTLTGLKSAGQGQPQRISHLASAPSGSGALVAEASGAVWAWDPSLGRCRCLGSEAQLPPGCQRVLPAPQDVPGAAGVLPALSHKQVAV